MKKLIILLAVSLALVGSLQGCVNLAAVAGNRIGRALVPPQSSSQDGDNQEQKTQR